MGQGRRSNLLLGGLVAIAIANGLLLGLSLYGLLAAALKVLSGQSPPVGLAWLAGAFAGAALLGLSLQRERALREGEYTLWTPFPSNTDHLIVERFGALVAASSLDRAPALGWIDSPEWNAFAVGRSRDDASIVLTAGLIEGLLRSASPSSSSSSPSSAR